jgi:hypothetical protein
MNWKKFLLIGLAVSALAFAAAPRAEARISVGIGFNGPTFGYYDYGYPRCYPNRYNYYYGPRRVVYVGPRHWHHNRRVYYPRRHHRHWR